MIRTVLCCAVLALAAGCGGEREDPAKIPGSPAEAKARAAEIKAVKADIGLLVAYEKVDEPEAGVIYDDARKRLEQRGSAIETQLIEALLNDAAWGVRFGVIEVLDSVGTRDCIETVIGALKDKHPEVAYKAWRHLKVRFDHDEIPAGGDPGANGLPPLPKPEGGAVRDPKKALELWAAWHAANADTHHRAWFAWWQANKRTVIAK